MSLVGHEIRLLNASFVDQAVLWNAHSQFDAISCAVKEVVEGEDSVTFRTADFTHETTLTDDDAAFYLRLINPRDQTYRTYHIKKHGITHLDGQKIIEVEGERIWIHLNDRYRYTNKKTFANISISTLLTDILANSYNGATAASSEFQLGTVASSTEVVDFFSIDWEPPLGAIRRLCKKMGREMSLDESTSPMTLDFPVAIGDSSSIAALRYGVNLRGVTRKQDYAERVTRMYAIGGGDPEVKLSASTLSGGNNYIDSANFDALDNNWNGLYRNTEIEDITNRIADADCPDLSGTYTAGLCAGWTKIGTPTVTENTDADFFQQGTKSQKVVAADGEGVSVDFTASTTERMVGWVNLYVSALGVAGVVRVEFTDADGVQWLNGEGLDTTGQFASVERQGLEFTSSSGTLKIYAEGDTATFYVDAAFVDNGDQFRKFVIGDMADVLYNEAAAELAKVDDDTAFVTYEVDGVDLFESFPDKYPDYQISLGDTIAVEDYEIPRLSASLRVAEKLWNVIRPEGSRFTVGKVLRTYADIATDAERNRLRAESRAREGQDRDARGAATPALTRPVAGLTTRFDGQFTSTAYNSFSWGAGTLHIGSDVKVAISSSSISALTASTSYWLYFDLADPTSGFQITATHADSVGPRKVQIAYVLTGSVSDIGCSVVPENGNRPQMSGDYIITGKISVGGASGNDRIDIDWASQDIVLYRGGVPIVDLGDISDTSLYATVGLAVDHPEGGVYVRRDGDVGTPGALLPAGIVCYVIRDVDEGNASPNEDIGFYCKVDIATKTTGSFGPGTAYYAFVDNDDGQAYGFYAASIEAESIRAVGFDATSIRGKASAIAAGLHVDAISAVDGNAYGVLIDNGISTSGSGTGYGIYCAASEDSYFAGNLGIGDASPSFKLDVNGTGRFAGKLDIDAVMEIGIAALGSAPTDAVKMSSADLSPGNTMLALLTEGTPVGSGTPTQNRTIAIEVNGTVYYILASTSAS